MKQKLIIGFSLLLFVVVVVRMTTDLFKNPDKSEKNDYEYNLEKFKQIDTAHICYKEIAKIKLDVPVLNAIALDSLLTAYIASGDEIYLFSKSFQKISSFKTDSVIHCLAVSNDGKVYAGISGHIEVFNNAGILLKKWNSFSDKGYIASLIIKDDHVYVADAGNRLLLQYDKEGNLVGIIGKKDKERGIKGFVIPSKFFDVALGQGHEIWVVNPGMHKMQHFSDDGDLLASWGSTSMELEGFSGCCNPVHFSILPDGHFVTYEKGLDRIKIYDRTGKFKCVVAGPSDINAEAMNVCTIDALVHDITVDNQGRIYVIDALNVLRIFQKKEDVINYKN